MQAVQKQPTIGASTVTLFRLADCFEVVAGILRTGKEGFPSCSLCPIRPRKVADEAALHHLQGLTGSFGGKLVSGRSRPYRTSRT